MIVLPNALLLVAHPGHELLLHGWVGASRPLVAVLTDGSGHSGQSRLSYTADLLAALGARASTIFGRFTDREAYLVIRERRADVLTGLVEEVAGLLMRHGIENVVCDAMEGFNPVHDLCRMIAGAACERVGAMSRYEYPIHERPNAYDGLSEVTAHNLDERALAAKIAAAHAMAPAIPDVAAMLDEWGTEPFRREALRRVHDWTVPGWPAGERPQYERTGEARVAEGRYDHVIRYGEHFVPLLAALRSTTLCAS